MTRGRIVALAVLGLFGLSGPALAATALEQQVLVALNQARADPSAYAKSLQHYRSYFRANLVRYPGQGADIETQEGVKVVDEAIAFLANRAPLQPVQPSALLGAAAEDLVSDQSGSGGTGHKGGDGSSPGDRARRHGGGTYVAEVIAYGPIDADDTVRQLIVDDGVDDRGHRNILYSPELRFVGVACGPHPEFRTMCVIDLGVTADGRELGGGRRTAAP